jgi:hypothetical protein
MLARYYSGWLGRWTASDPMANELPHQSSYMYCSGNPVSRIDHNGMYDIVTGEIHWGDTLTGITKQINEASGKEYTVDDVAKANNIKNPDLIYAGKTINLPTFSVEKLGENHYSAIHDKLKNTPVEIGESLRTLWGKYESQLKVFEMYSVESVCTKIGGVIGVFIDIYVEEQTEDTQSLLPYQAIFHEFFHNIDALTSFESVSYNDNEFGKTIQEEAKAISEADVYNIKEEFKPQDTAYLFDILGGVHGKGDEYGFGHKQEYWDKGGLSLLSKETFANMAAAAVTNPAALDVMAKRLPNSYAMFTNIVTNMVKR